MERCKGELVVASEGVSNQDVAPGDVRLKQQVFQFGRDVQAVASSGGFLAPSQSRSVVRADARELRHLGLNERPGGGRVAQTRVEQNGGASLSAAVEMHAMSVHLHQDAGHWIAPLIYLGRAPLKEESCEQNQYGEQGQRLTSENHGPGLCIAHASHHDSPLCNVRTVASASP